MERMKFRPRTVDRFIFCVLAILHIANGLYLVGPWYLEETASGKSPLLSLFNDDKAVAWYGFLLLIDGLFLLYASASASTRRFYTRIVSGALLAGFLLRLYSLIGVLLTIESWRPPGYLSQMASVAFLGIYWVWVRVNARVIQ